jgi:hypothetical protein
MEGTDSKSIPFQDQNKANLMTQVSIQVNKIFYLFDCFIFVEFLETTCL